MQANIKACNKQANKPMQIKIFNISSSCSNDEIETINRFLRSNRIIDIDKQFCPVADACGVWSLFVTYIPVQNEVLSSPRREKVDYKELLNREEFEKFTQLRAIRKQLANDDAVPAYAVFSDAELAQMAQMPSISSTAIGKIHGIGERRIEKYGKLLVEHFNSYVNETE